MNIKLINEDILKVDFSQFQPPNVVITSPPYNLNIPYDSYNDNKPYGEYLGFTEEWVKKLYDVMPDDGRICVNIPFGISPEIENQNSKDGNFINHPLIADYINIFVINEFKYWRSIVWDKHVSMKTCWGSWCSAKSPFLRDPCEIILVFYKTQWTRLTEGKSTITGEEFMSLTKNIWSFLPETKPYKNHPAAFPIDLPLNCLKLFSYENDTILDPFLGSGSTGVAAVQLNRNFVGVEISKQYFTDAKKRINSIKYSKDLQTTLLDIPEQPDLPPTNMDLTLFQNYV